MPSRTVLLYDRAKHSLTGEQRTLKVFSQDDAEALVAHEYGALRSIEDPHIGRVYDAGHSDAGWYMTSEYLAGEVPALRIDTFDGMPRPGEVCLIGHELLNALSVIHVQGAYRRDVKLENVIILVADRGAVLFDFGVAAGDRTASLCSGTSSHRSSPWRSSSAFRSRVRRRRRESSQPPRSRPATSTRER